MHRTIAATGLALAATVLGVAPAGAADPPTEQSLPADQTPPPAGGAPSPSPPPAGAPAAPAPGPAPAAAACESRRRIVVTFRAPRGARLRSATARLRGNALPVRVRRGVARVTVDLRRRPYGTYRVVLSGRTTKGKRTSDTRTCRPR